MDKIAQRIPLRNKSIKQPVLFTFNISLNHYNGFRTAHYDTVQKVFKQQQKVRTFQLLPNITNVSMNIEERAANIAKQVQEISKQTGKKVHLVSHSFCGVDCRAAIELLGAHQHVDTLTTVCSPHLGLRLIDAYNKSTEKYTIEMADRTFDILGISLKNVQEFTPFNMKHLNEITESQGSGQNVQYYSIGSQTSYHQVADMLKHSHDIISEGLGTNRSDGLVMPEEAKWGEYLVTFQQDHLEMVGFNPDYVPSQVYSLVADNIRLSEIIQNKKEAAQYGVDHLEIGQKNQQTQNA